MLREVHKVISGDAKFGAQSVSSEEPNDHMTPEAFHRLHNLGGLSLDHATKVADEVRDQVSGLHAEHDLTSLGAALVEVEAAVDPFVAPFLSLPATRAPTNPSAHA